MFHILSVMFIGGSGVPRRSIKKIVTANIDNSKIKSSSKTVFIFRPLDTSLCTIYVLAELDTVFELVLEVVHVPGCTEALPDFLTDEGQSFLCLALVIFTADLKINQHNTYKKGLDHWAIETRYFDRQSQKTIICRGKIKRLFLVSLDNSFPFDSRQVKIWICFKYLIPGEGSIFNRCVKNIFAKNYLTCFENGSRTITVSVMRQYASDWRIWYFIWILTFGVIYSQWCVTHVSLTLKTGNPLNKMASFTLK